MKPTLIRSFAHELEKRAVNVSTLQSYLARRATQGVGGADALAKSLGGTTARTSREALQSMTGLQKHRLEGVLEGGKAHRAMQKLPERVGLGQVTQNTRQRVADAIKAEAAGERTRAGGVPLSKTYEGYATSSQRSYTPKHVEQVMGLEPGQHVPKEGPTKLMRPEKVSTTGSGSQSTSEVTVPSRPSMPPHMVPTVRPPARQISVPPPM